MHKNTTTFINSRDDDRRRDPDDEETEVEQVVPLTQENYPSLGDTQTLIPEEFVALHETDDFTVGYISPLAAGYALFPRYTGLFSPFGGSTLCDTLMKTVGESRYERLFGGVSEVFEGKSDGNEVIGEIDEIGDPRDFREGQVSREAGTGLTLESRR